jgi:sec-independent protein translocase protein TatC
MDCAAGCNARRRKYTAAAGDAARADLWIVGRRHHGSGHARVGSETRAAVRHGRAPSQLMTEPGEQGDLAEGTLISHLLELRDRLLKAMLAVGICFIPCAIYMNQLFSFVADPLIHKLPAGATLIATSVVSPFTVPFKLALVLAIGIAIPFVLYQAWAFVAPGLYKHEKKLAVPLLISSVLLFYLGAAFAYYAVFPVMLSFFVATTPHGVQMMTDMSAYLDFVMILLLAFGLAFEVPVATVLLVWTGFVRLATLKKNRGFVLLGIFIFAAFVTPPDAVSQSAMAVPMYLLYEIGIIMAGLLLKDKIAARAKEDAEQAEREAGV